MDKCDGSGNDYIDVGNLRVTGLLQGSYDDGPAIRIQAYQDDGRLLKGPELNIDHGQGYELIAAIASMMHKLVARRPSDEAIAAEIGIAQEMIAAKVHLDGPAAA